VPLHLWVSEGCVLFTGANLGLSIFFYARSVRLLRDVMADPRLAGMLPTAERSVYVQRGTLAFLSMALLIIVRVHLANLGVFPFALPTQW